MNLSTTSVDYVNPFHSKNNLFISEGLCMTNLDRQLKRAIFKGKLFSIFKAILLNPKVFKVAPKIIAFIFRRVQKRFLKWIREFLIHGLPTHGFLTLL